MYIRILSIKKLMCSVIIILTCLAFPLQVIAMSPLPALLPYLFFSLLIMLSLFYKNSFFLQRWDLNNSIEILITLFFVLINVSTFLQLYWGLISPIDVLTVYIMYVFPILFYVYFSRTVSDSELRVIMKTILILGIINALYYLIDNYNQVLMGEVSAFTIRMNEYSNFRVGTEVNNARIWTFHRGHGLLERHSVSSAWVAIGSFAYFAVKPNTSTLKKSTIIVFTILILLFCMNFTSLVGYIAIIAIFELNYLQLIFGKLYINALNKTFFVMFSIFLLFIPILLIFENSLIHYLFDLTLNQIYLAIGVNEYAGSVFLGGLARGLFEFPFLMSDYPIGLILGDGYSNSFSIIGRGGDFGLVETLFILGMPFFLIVMYGFTRLIFKTYNLLHKKYFVNIYHAAYLKFAMYTTALILFHEIHMSIWNAKSILPILFLNLAIFNKYLFKNSKL